MVSKLTNYQLNVPDAYITHSKTQFTASIANHSARAVLAGIGGTPGLVNIPGIAGRMYTLYGIEIVNKSTLTTLVPTGGLVEIFNDAIDWVPFQSFFNTSSAAGANAGAPQTPTFIPVNKPLPAGSNITCFYTSQNAATDWLSVTFFWSTKPYTGAQTFINCAYGTARSSVATFTADGTITIPANKGGNCVGFLAQCYGNVVTVLSTGGNIAVHNAAANTAWEPTEFVVGSNTSIGTGASELVLLKLDQFGDAPGNSSFTFDFTTISTNSQQNGYAVVWEA